MKGTRINYKGSEYNTDGDRPVDLDKIPKVKSLKELKKAIADKEMLFVHITKDKMYGINKLTYKRQKFLLLEPNPVTFYFSLAFDSIQQLEIAKKQFENSLILDARDGSKAQAFSYIFKVGSVCAIFSFLALEAFLNQMLPDYALIEYEGKMVTKNKIQRWTSFEDKLSKIIPKLYGKDFGEKNPKKLEKIILLKRLRDELTHLKEIKKNGFTSYDEIYQDILNTDLKSIVFTVKAYINFYSPKLITNYKNKTKIR